MSQHTPGPWQVHKDRLTVGDGPTSQLAHCVYRADARLIAKAPEMLTMLTSCLAYFDDMKNARIHCDNNDHDRPCSGELFAPDPEWTAPIRALLREIDAK